MNVVFEGGVKVMCKGGVKVMCVEVACQID